MLYITKETVNDIMKWDNKPAGYCKSGETVVFETRDCYDNTITSSERPLGDREGLSNPVTGALYVEGAEVGDILKVEIEDIKLRSWGVMRSSTTAGVFHEKYEKREAIIFQVKDNKIYFDDKLILDADPMIGVIGTAPSEKEILDLMENKPEDVELVLTGRYAPQSVIDKADLVTEMKEIKHYYSKGVMSRDGIER